MMIKYTSKEIISDLFESPMVGLAKNTERIISKGYRPNTKYPLKNGIFVEFIPTTLGVRKIFYYRHARIAKNTALSLIKKG